MQWKFNGDIVRGGVKIASDLECDFRNHNFYVKGMLVDDKGNCVPKDIEITKGEFSGLSIKFTGTERSKNKPIQLAVSYNVLRQKAHIEGKIGAFSFNNYVSSYDEIFAVIAKI